ncbi:MAG: hypothetical protein JXR70_05895 [Spirochaetales bacterium]|nr:hypothetical protein [Spirochaetales bacterium]
MSINYYLSQNPFSNGKKYFARTITNSQISEKELLEAMAGKGTSLTPTELRGVVDLLKNTISEFLIKGSQVELYNFITLSPRVKSNINDNDQPFSHKTGQIKVFCRINKKLTDALRKAAVVERKDNEEKAPKITDVKSGKAKENAIRWPYSTSLKGNNLQPYGCHIKGIEMVSIENDTLNLVVPVKDLIMDHTSAREISFSINHNFTIPDWLTKQLPIYLRIQYTGETDRMTHYSKVVKTYWLSAPQETTNSTNNKVYKEEVA